LELKYLPVIESALNPKAVSRAGAAGLWQFMITTGKQYGLQVNSLVDERRDPIKSSYAAARYLRDLYKIFGDWNLVIAAYNCGPENINKAIRRAGGENKDYWHIYPYLPRETRGYVPAFIAANYAMTYYSLHNICPMSTRLPVKSDTVMVSRDVHLEQVAEVVGINIDLLRSLNPQYRRDIIPGNSEPCALRLPQSEVGKFLDQEDSVYTYKVDELLTRRTQVDINDDVPTYYHKSKRWSKKKSRYSRRRASVSKRRSSASKRRSSGNRKRRRR
jgi:membrane-bound lytic murein transglycosylase D